MLGVATLVFFVGFNEVAEHHVPRIALEIGEQVPDATFLSVLDGSPPVRIADLRGKVVLLYVWATWCPSCKGMMPGLAAIRDSLEGPGFVSLFVAYNKTRDSTAVRTYLGQVPAVISPRVPQSSSFYRDYAVFGVPRTYLIGADGTLLWSALGPPMHDASIAAEGREALARALTAVRQ